MDCILLVVILFINSRHFALFNTAAGTTVQGRVLHRRDLSTTAQLLAAARAEFHAAGDLNGASEADEALVKIKADIVMEAIEAARKVRGKL